VTASTLLDLGTGTGQAVQALLHHFTDIFAVDPDSAMVDLAKRSMVPQVPANSQVRFEVATAEEFQPPEGWSASLVTICRAFHWMDQPRLLNRLATFVPDTGVVAIFGDRSFWDADNIWKTRVRSVVQSFLGEPRRAGTGTFSHHDRPYTEILRESPFHEVTEVVVPVRRVWSSQEILGYLYSTSFAARDLFGDRVQEFESALAHELKRDSDIDAFEEQNAFTIRFGRKAPCG
jgi:SAM-dependent methyltransferase